jgi:hypothetical protein
MRMLFVSFTGTLRAMSQGSVSESDLASGLFHFGCGRPHAMDPSGKYNEVTWFYKDPVAGVAAHKLLVDALLKAESDGRVLWADDARAELDKLEEEDCKYARQEYLPLSNFLVRNGFKSGIAFKNDDLFLDGGHYNYPGVADRVREANLDLEVIC